MMTVLANYDETASGPMMPGGFWLAGSACDGCRALYAVFQGISTIALLCNLLVSTYPCITRSRRRWGPDRSHKDHNSVQETPAMSREWRHRMPVLSPNYCAYVSAINLSPVAWRRNPHRCMLSTNTAASSTGQVHVLRNPLQTSFRLRFSAPLRRCRLRH